MCVRLSSLPLGTVTHLFTDIEGSTSLWQKFPQAILEVSALHDWFVRAAIGVPVEPVAHPAYDQLLDKARAVLDDTRFATAWAAGRAQPFEHAIAEAMSD